ncbi:hypothetical protein Ocin01_06145, partial [Orchesella cincta]
CSSGFPSSVIANRSRRSGRSNKSKDDGDSFKELHDEADRKLLNLEETGESDLLQFRKNSDAQLKFRRCFIACWHSHNVNTKFGFEPGIMFVALKEVYVRNRKDNRQFYIFPGPPEVLNTAFNVALHQMVCIMEFNPNQKSPCQIAYCFLENTVMMNLDSKLEISYKNLAGSGYDAQRYGAHSGGGRGGSSGGYGGSGGTNNGGTGGTGGTGTAAGTNNAVKSGAICNSAGTWGKDANGQQCVCARPQRAKRHYNYYSGGRYGALIPEVEEDLAIMDIGGYNGGNGNSMVEG